jgi:sugar lactone lactonase YvrE
LSRGAVFLIIGQLRRCAMKRLYALIVCLSLPGLLMAQEAPGTITPISISATISTVDAWGNLYEVYGTVFSPDGRSNRFLAPPTDQPKTKIRDFGDGGRAIDVGWVHDARVFDDQVSIGVPPGIAVDLKGTIYFSSPGDQRIRRVDPNGTIWTAAGSGERVFGASGFLQDYTVRGGFSGDGLPATQAQLNKPSDVALDARGNLYIADTGNGRIRLVDREGFIHTFAGNGGRSGDPLGDGGAAINAMLYAPVSIAVDLKGNVYVAEPYAHRVRKIAADDQRTITTFAGTGKEGYSGDGGPAAQAQLNFPLAVAVDVAGNVYIADRENHRIRKVDPNGVITTFAGNETGGAGMGFGGDGGPAIQARMERPREVLPDAKGYVYIAAIGSASDSRVRRVSPLKPFEIPSIRLSASSLAFEATNVNTPVEQILTVSNAGKETPLLVEVAVDRFAPEFKIVSPTNFPVQPGGSQTVTVRFTPTSLTSMSSAMKVYHSGVEEKPLTVSLRAIPGSTKSADFDGNGKVDFDDFFLFAAAFGSAGTGENAKFDLDGSGKIDFDDFFLFAGRFGR